MKLEKEKALVLIERENVREMTALSESRIAAKEHNARAMEEDAKEFMQDLQKEHHKLKWIN